MNIFFEQVQNKDENFSNGHLVRNLYDKIIINHAKRIISEKLTSIEDLSLLKNCDFDFVH